MMFFHVGEKWYIQSEATEVCEFCTKIPAFYRHLQLAEHFADIWQEKVFSKCFSQSVFLVKKVKNSWNSFVCFAVDEKNCREVGKKQQKEKNRTRCQLKLCFLSELLCLLFKLNKLIFKAAILLKFIHFQYVHSEQTVRISCSKLSCSSWITSYPYPRYIFNKRFHKQADT